MKTTTRFLAPVLLGLTVAACMNLDVLYEDQPTSDRALAEPGAVENVIKSAFTLWFGVYANTGDYHYFAGLADFTNSGTNWYEPRVLITDPGGRARTPWDNWNSYAANAIDALHRIIDDKLIIRTLDVGGTAVEDHTDRARVFAKLMEALNLGYIGLMFDRGDLRSHYERIPTGLDDLLAWEKEHMKPYPEVMALAIKVLDDAIADIDRSPAFTIPIEYINGEVYTSAQLRMYANSLKAKLLVYAARSPAEREKVDWQAVLKATQSGLDFNLAPTLATGVLTASWLNTIQQTNPTFRANYRLIGPADTSGAYQAWTNAPLNGRNRFDIRTPDRRITGTTPTAQGAYFRYKTDNNSFVSVDGTYSFSAYQWYRYAGAFQTGKVAPLITADENRLLRAEALLRTGDLVGAAQLINVSRMRTVTIGTATFPGLPAVTTAGVPQSTGCVPRSPRTGACGTLMEALMYERGIELAGMDPFRGYVDFRGFGLLPEGTPIHMPVPIRYLVVLGIDQYFVGGAGGEHSAGRPYYCAPAPATCN
jgi:hypothetical protein